MTLSQAGDKTRAASDPATLPPRTTACAISGMPITVSLLDWDEKSIVVSYGIERKRHFFFQNALSEKGISRPFPPISASLTWSADAAAKSPVARNSVPFPHRVRIAA
ncbi:hypothetical protein GCM10009848_21130 [Micromonospora lupini]